MGRARALAAAPIVSLAFAFAPLVHAQASGGSSPVPPLDDTGSGITRDVGAIAVIEHDGSAYDRRGGDGLPDSAARARVARRFYQAHGDNYDFLIVFTNFDFDTGGSLAFHTLVRNHVAGIGKPILDNGEQFGSPGRLLGYVDMAALSRYRSDPLSLRPGHPGFRATLNVVAHEMAHQWLAEARYRREDGQVSSDLLGLDASHWSALLDSDGSVMYGSDWVPNGDGTYTAERVQDLYSSLDLYLMGLLPAPRVGPITLLRSAVVDPASLPVEGAVIAAAPETVTIEQVVAAEGGRQPDAGRSPKTFRVAFVFLTSPGTEPSAEDLEAVDRVRRAFAAHFFALTRGVAVADTDLVPEVTPSPAVPDLPAALSWLAARQAIDGHWEDAPLTAVRDTTAALEALLHSGGQDLAVFRARTWVTAAAAPNVDFQARRATATASALDPVARAESARALLEEQNADGGFGLAAGYESDALDTALALRALRVLDRPADTRVRAAVTALQRLRSADGGWPAVSGEPASTAVTAQVLLALQDWPAIEDAAAMLGPGLAALLERRNSDGGFGESPSTTYATALALQALMRAGAPAAVIDGGVGWLQSAQRPDGSWSGSPYETALVLTTLKHGLAANLTAPADGLALSPASPREGEVVEVTARVENAGRAPSIATTARLFDGVVAAGSLVAEAAVPALAAGEAFDLAFQLPTEGRPGSRVLYVVVDPDGLVAESREDDNTVSRALQVAGLLPDLVLHAASILVEPYPPEEGETVGVSVLVRNVAPRASAESLLRLVDGDPRSGGRVVGAASVPGLLPGAEQAVLVPWTVAGPRTVHTLTAIADAASSVPESDETNNAASVPVEVRGPGSSDPDLEIASVIVDPGVLSRLPVTAAVTVHVRNLGTSPAEAVVALYDGDPGGESLVGSQAVPLAGRSGTTFTFAFPVATPGSRLLTAVADPLNHLGEPDETNNVGRATLSDPRNTADLEVLSEDVTVSPAPAVVGDRVRVSARVRNRGTAALSRVAVFLVHEGEGSAELLRREVTVEGGGTAEVALEWTSSIVGDPVPLAVIVDPFGLVPELDETNNRAALGVVVAPSTQPNLAASGADVSFSPDPPLEGGTATVSAVIRNTGAVPAGPFVVRFWRGDPGAGGTPIGETTVPGVDAHGSTMAALTWSPVDARGAQGVFVVVDAQSEVAEYDETDNQAFRPFGVLGLPDLVLTVASVDLVPRFPRAGEPVTIRATVRNLGGQTSVPTAIGAVEGDTGEGTAVGEASLGSLGPGQQATVELAWVPNAPPGERTLRISADPGDLVREQDEGNNSARLAVVVQDADVYLTEAYFSPDGDGVQDRTTLAYRATSAVDVVVSDGLGRLVRTLAKGAPPSGTVEWDGRNEHGALVADGQYTFNVLGTDGRTLARATVVLDLDRLSLHYASRLRPLLKQALTCRTPAPEYDRVWMPAGDEVLLLVRAAEGVPAGLLRVRPGGDFVYVSQDPLFAAPGVSFASRQAVSPDGLEVLVRRQDELLAVDLLDGQVRSLGTPSLYEPRWSPDGRWIAGGALLARDGTIVRECCLYGAWSPDSSRLAQGNRIVDRETGEERIIPVPGYTGAVDAQQTAWRSDGTIFVRLGTLGLGGQAVGYALDPESGTATEIPWMADPLVGDPIWSTDGLRALYFRNFGWEGEGAGAGEFVVANEDGTSEFPLPGVYEPSPNATAAINWEFTEDPSCRDRFPLQVLRSAENITADLQALRLPGNAGIVLRGTASDQNLDHYQLDYASSSEPTLWRPLGPAWDVPVVDDVLTVWAPAEPGTYLVRLTAQDRAGNARTSTRVIVWDRRASVAHVSQTERVVSPNGDGRKDAVTFNYLVVEPSRVEVEISGPEREGETPTIVRRLAFEYPEAGPASFEWDGRDGSGQVVPDGRYTVAVNGLPFRLEVDGTPPEVAWSYSEPVFEEVTVENNKKKPAIVVDRIWRVGDAGLKRWQAGPYRGTDPQHATDAGGLPAPRRDRRATAKPGDRDEVLRFATESGHVLEAEDHAGNRSLAPIFPLPDRIFVLGAVFVHLDGKAHGGILPPFDPELVHGAVPHIWQDGKEQYTEFQLVETLPGPVVVTFQQQPRAGGAWTDVQSFGGDGELRWRDLGVAPIPAGVRRGRFVARAGPREAVSETFLFQICAAAMSLRVAPESTEPRDLGPYHVQVVGSVPERLVSARIRVTRIDGPGFTTEAPLAVAPANEEAVLLTGTVMAPVFDCGPVLEFKVEAVGESGKRYRPESSDGCLQLALLVAKDACLAQAFEYCAGSPDRIAFRGSLNGVAPGSTLTFERGPETDPIVMGEVTDLAGHVRFPPRQAAADASGLPEGDVKVRARLRGPAVAAAPSVVVGVVDVVVDRTPARLESMTPEEGAEACIADSGFVDLRLVFEEAGEDLLLANQEYRQGSGAWQPMCLTSVCLPGLRPEPALVKAAEIKVNWNAASLPQGEYTIRLTFCDRAGHTTVVERRLALVRDPPRVVGEGASSEVFSPNGDGDLDTTTVSFSTTRALTAKMEVEDAAGHVVGLVAPELDFAAGTHALTWDGRATGGGEALPDGPYAVTLTGTDACRRSVRFESRVRIDTRPPTASITRPVPDQTVGASVDVSGTATDENLDRYELSFGQGTAPLDWTSLGLARGAVAEGLLGHWDTPATAGTYALRLVAVDKGHNRSSATVPVVVGPRTFIDRLAATPAAFSPNGDGRAESTSIQYGLLLPGRVRLEVLRGPDEVVRTLEADVPREAGTYVATWDGLGDSLQPAADGDLTVRLKVTDPGTGATQQDAVSVILDRAPPAVAVDLPADGAVVPPDQVVRGSVTDLHLAEYVVAVQDGSELSRGGQGGTDLELASLAGLADGPVSIVVTAEDRALNRTQTVRPFAIDGRPPAVALHAPADGAVVARASAATALVGTATDANLVDYVLRLGPGASPAYFDEVGRGTSPVLNGPLASWVTSRFADGLYTLRLVATDRAGLSSEASVNVTVDGTPPTALLTAPTEGQFVNAGLDVTGTAADVNLESWTLEAAPGSAAEAFQWSPVASGQAPVDAGVLGSWGLPADGLHTLRLVVRDKAGHETAALRTVTVDTVPPAPPTGLAATVRRTAEATAEIALTWDANTEDDLAGYRVSRDAVSLDPLHAEPTHLDEGRPEGTYRYAVAAVDRAGNASASALLTVKVDLTPPVVRIAYPTGSVAVSGSVEVRGTAVSADDFKEYRLSVGTGSAPSDWTLLRRSALGVASGALGTWLAATEGTYLLALEAEDFSGNVARVTSTLTVDTHPPSAPVLTAVDAGAEPSSLLARWEVAPEPDVAGYLLYRDGRLANSSDLLLGDPVAYLIAATSWLDTGLPDGTRCYRVVAVDAAGNHSAASNEICRAVDARPPHVTLVTPPSGTRFGFPVDVLAETADTDVASVEFQTKAVAASAWTSFGTDTDAPFRAVLDPDTLVPGAHHVRAVATDAGGRSDPSPPTITVTSFDSRAPAAPTGLVAQVDEWTVSLSWTPPPDADVVRYNLYVDGNHYGLFLPDPWLTYQPCPYDPLGCSYRYEVTAVDADENESARSEAVDVVVYMPEIDARWPVVEGATATVAGGGVPAGVTVEVSRDEAVLGQAAADESGRFLVLDVPLDPGPNIIHARGRDEADNRSAPSEPRLLVLNAAPSPPADLAGMVEGRSATLGWTPVADPEVVGYAVKRGQEVLTPVVPVTEVGYAASYDQPYGNPWLAVDGDPATAWIPGIFRLPGWWMAWFGELVPVTGVELQFRGGSGPEPVADYTIRAEWDGYLIPLLRVRGNAQATVRHDLPAAFATYGIQVVVESGNRVGLGEVKFFRRQLVAADTATYTDADAGNGRFAYHVSAVDRYGAESTPSTVELEVGDAVGPDPPTGLAATVVGSDVRLSWQASEDPDVGRYEVFRDGAPAGIAAVAEFLDAARANGTYVYTVVAVDGSGNASDPSAPLSVTVAVAPPAAPVLSAAPAGDGTIALAWTHEGAEAFSLHRGLAPGGPYEAIGMRAGDVRAAPDRAVSRNTTYFYVARALDAAGNVSLFSNEASAQAVRTRPPAPPVIEFPTRAGQPLTLTTPRAHIRGRAETGSLVSLRMGGALVGAGPALPAFAEVAALPLVESSSFARLSPDGRWLAQSVPGALGARLHITDLVTGVGRSLGQDEGGDPADDHPQAFSPDGRYLVYDTSGGAGEFAWRVLSRLDLDTGEQLSLDGSGFASDAAWSPDGAWLAWRATTWWAGHEIVVEDRAAQVRTTFSVDREPRGLRWSPDGRSIAFVAVDGGSAELRVLDVEQGSETVVASSVWPESVPSWSADGTRLAYTELGPAGRSAVVRGLAEGEAGAVPDAGETWGPQFDGADAWLSYVRVGGSVETVAVQSLAASETRVVATRPIRAEPEAPGWLSGGWLAVALPGRMGLFPSHEGAFAVDGVALRAGENLVRARATDELEGEDSDPVSLTVAGEHASDLAVGVPSLYPALPAAGQPALVSARVENVGLAPASSADVRLSVLDAGGVAVAAHTVTVTEIAPGGAVVVSLPWTPPAAGDYTARAQADPDHVLPESAEDNNAAERSFQVAARAELQLALAADRPTYAAGSAAVVTIEALNGGAPVAAELRTSVEDAEGREVVLLDARGMALPYGHAERATVSWNTGRTYAGAYTFRIRALDAEGTPVAADATAAFTILSDLAVGVRVVPGQALVPVGRTQTFSARVENIGTNTPLSGAVARLSVVSAGTMGPASFEVAVALPTLLPGGAWEGTLTWPSATGAGAHTVLLQVAREDGGGLATASAGFTVGSAASGLRGTVSADPAHLLAGSLLTAQVTVTNAGSTALTGQAVDLDLVSGPGATIVHRQTFVVDLAPAQTHAAAVDIPTAALLPGAYSVLVRPGGTATTLARATVNVHGPVVAPSLHAPADGDRVTTAHPALSVNNGAGATGVPLTYEFQVYLDAGLTVVVAQAAGVAEGAGRTSWRVPVNLAEDRLFHWRARASDGFSSSAWTPASSFRVDAVNRPPAPPVVDGPPFGARVATREPVLTVKNAQDDDLDVLTYDFRLSLDAEMTALVAQAAGVTEGPGLTAWTAPIALEEDATYYWSARAADPYAASAWSTPAAFQVDTFDAAPSAPTLRRPADGSEVATLAPELVVGNATDPERRPLTYRFEVDRSPSFDTAALQAAEVPEGGAETAWVPAAVLADNALHFWRAAADDGTTQGPWATGSFFVNLANDPPGAPTAIEPDDGQMLATATPTFRIRNALDADLDPLVYDFEVTTPEGVVVQAATGVEETPVETAWTLPSALTENGTYLWSARGRDAESDGPWTAPRAFRVNAVADPPTAPVPAAPTEGETVATRRPTLAVSNATSPDLLALTYEFELFVEAFDGSLTLLDAVTGVPEGPSETSWTPAVDLPDARYAWRARATDPVQSGPWMATARFSVLVDPPPAAPTGLTAVAGDGRISLTWAASVEPDVRAYRVHRASQAGGPYTGVGETEAPAFEDAPLANGVTVHYVVTALDAQAESAYSAEVSATPRPLVVAAEVRYAPPALSAACLLAGDVADGCPTWLFATIELPALSPVDVELASLLLAGDVPADEGYSAIVDGDGDGLDERLVRFELRRLRGHLVPGSNRLRLSGRAAGYSFAGEASVEVTPLRVDLRMTPRTLNKKSGWQWVEARLSFSAGVEAAKVDVLSLRFGDVVRADRVVSAHQETLTVKFDRASVAALLPVGSQVEVWVSGVVGGVPFTARDVIRVIQ